MILYCLYSLLMNNNNTYICRLRILERGIPLLFCFLQEEYVIFLRQHSFYRKQIINRSPFLIRDDTERIIFNYFQRDRNSKILNETILLLYCDRDH